MAEPVLRRIRPHELAELLALYRHLHPRDPAPPMTDATAALWRRICGDPSLRYLGAEVAGGLVATCALAIIPNLTRGPRPYGLIENVVTHPDFRRRGIGTALLRFALRAAWDEGCYKVMLLTGSSNPDTLRFYERAGFKAGLKAGFVAYPE